MIAPRWTSISPISLAPPVPSHTPAHELEALFVQWHGADDKNAFMCSLPLNQARELLDLIVQRTEPRPVISRRAAALARIASMLPADAPITAEQVYTLLIERHGKCPRFDHLQRYVVAALKELSR